MEFFFLTSMNLRYDVMCYVLSFDASLSSCMIPYAIVLWLYTSGGHYM
jgi:hypothetical protein